MAIFAIVVRIYVFVMCGFCAYRITKIVKRELFLKLNKKMQYLHISILGLMFAFGSMYQISDIIW